MKTPKKIVAFSSKSYLQRALAISALAKGTTTLNAVSHCKDSLVAKEIIQKLGVSILEEKDITYVQSGELSITTTYFDFGESALSLRMFSPILALFDTEIILRGEASLSKRPIQMIEETLRTLGVTVESQQGCLPLHLKGPLQAGDIQLDGALSSQLLTGLLIALPLLEGDSVLSVQNLKSKPYIDMTLEVMKAFGVSVINEAYKTFRIQGGQQYKPINYTIEGDWSGASFFLVYGAVKGAIEVENLNPKSLQADRAILDVLEDVGAKISIYSQSIVVEKNQLKAFEFDATDCPDLFPPLVCLASQCKGVSKIKGISRLKHKESDRAKILKQEFDKIGIKIILDKDFMLIEGGVIKSGIIDSNNDHRIAMAGGIMNLFCNDEITIVNKEAVHKSYPTFFEVLNTI